MANAMVCGECFLKLFETLTSLKILEFLDEFLNIIKHHGYCFEAN